MKPSADFAIPTLAILTATAVAFLVFLVISPSVPEFAQRPQPSVDATPVKSIAQPPAVVEFSPVSFVQPTPDISATKRLVAVLTSRILNWEENDDPALRGYRMRDLQNLLAGTDLFAVLQQFPPNLTGYLFALPLVRQKLLADPNATLAWMEVHPNIAGPQLVTFLHDWYAAQSQQMQQVIAAIPSGQWRETVLEAAANNLLSSDPVTAIDFAVQLTPSQAQSRLLTMGVTAWSSNDPVSASEWTSQITNAPLRNQLDAAILGSQPSPSN